LFAIALTLLVFGCERNSIVGSGKQVTEPRNVSGLNAVEVKGSGELTVEQTGMESLTITAEDNLLPYLTSDVSGGRLMLGTKENAGISSSSPVLYKLTVKNLDEITLGGSGAVNGKGLNADSLKIVIGGSGSMTVEGTAARTEVLLAGSGSYRDDGLQSKDVKIKIMGSGRAVLAASEKLDVTIVGSGSVRYVGNQ
jgi:hypothetical protein